MDGNNVSKSHPVRPQLVLPLNNVSYEERWESEMSQVSEVRNLFSPESFNPSLSKCKSINR